MAELAGQSQGDSKSWADALSVYRHPRVIVMLFLGFSAGLPLLLIFGTLSAWLRQEDVSRTTIGFFSWVGLLFTFKFAWAPVVDRIPIPVLTRTLGKRRSWMLLGQIGIAIALVGIAFSDPANELTYVALLALLLAFSSATQDIAIDAYRIEAVAADLQGAMAATYQLGYRAGMIASGAGALYVAAFGGWQLAYLAMAALVSIGVATVFVIQEPTPKRDAATVEREERLARSLTGAPNTALGDVVDWFSRAVISPFADFFSRMGSMGVVILLFIAVYRLSDVTLGIMANPFYIDLGFSLVEIANITKVYGVIMMMVGAVFGGIAVSRYGIMKPLLAGAILVASTNLMFASLALVGKDITYLALTISADNFSAGFAGAPLIAYLSSLTNTAYTATQYALFSSLFLLPGKIMGGFSGLIVDAAGYFNFFLFATALGTPAIMLTIFLMARGPKIDVPDQPAAARSSPG